VYTANVTGTSNTGVTWSVEGVSGGNTTVGTINSAGMYTAPATPPVPSSVDILATSVADTTKSGKAVADIRVHHDNQDPQSGAIKLGTSGGNATDRTTSGNNVFCCSGTLGAVISRGGTFYVLSNNHVLDKSDQGATGDPISQPGLADSNCGRLSNKTVANLFQAAPLKTSNVDAAMAEIVPGQVDTSGSILDLAAPGQAAPPSSSIAAPAVNQGVAKSGDATGVTCSTVFATDALIQVTYSTACQGGTDFKVVFNGQIAITGGGFSNSGDSGSLVVESSTARPVGLLYAGSSNNTVANPIQDVLTALKDPNTSEVPKIVGTSVAHQVACPATPQAQIATEQSAVSTIGLPQREISRAAAAKDNRGSELMQDASVARIEVGRSADNPDESAVVLFLNQRPRLPIPAQINGVRTRVVFNTTSAAAQSGIVESAAAIPESEITKARGAKQQHAAELMNNPAILGVGVGASNDSPGEAALVIFVEQGRPVAVPSVIDGVRTHVITTDPIRAYNWGKRTVRACSRR